MNGPSGSSGDAGSRPRRLDLDSLLDQQAVSASQVFVVGLCLLAMVVDGFDLFMISMMIPPIAADFGVAPAAVAPVVVLQNAGLAVGTYFAGPLADRFGRKRVLMSSVLGFSLLTIASTFATSLCELSVLRSLTGIFLAGVVPNTIARTSEIVPARYRAGFVGLMFSGYAVGGIVSSLTSGLLLAGH